MTVTGRTGTPGARAGLPEANMLAAIVTSSNDAIIGEALDGTIESWNPAAERIFGWSAQDALGRNINLILPASRQGEQDEMRDAVLAGRSVERFESVRTRKDNSNVEVSITVSPILDGEGKVCGLSKIARDVTEEKRLARLKDEFLTTVTHELRTPLNGIVGWLQLLRDGAVGDGGRDNALDAIERAAGDQLRVIDQLLEARLGATGQMQLAPTRVDLIAIVREAVEVMRPASDAKELALDTQLEVDHLPLRADGERLQQAIWNVVANAIKFTDRRGRVTVTVGPVGDTQARVTVADTGAGISPEFLPAVFDQFRQADQSRTRQHGGLGLGLSLVRRIVELHGGTVRAQSAGLGNGATFTITLPRGSAF